MLKKSLAVALAGVGLTLVAAGAASADVTTSPADGFGGSTTAVTGDQSGLLTLNSQIADLRCATPWYGSAVVGGSTPIGTQNVVCNDVKAPITQLDGGKNSVL
jgi:hypothetical protein